MNENDDKVVFVVSREVMRKLQTQESELIVRGYSLDNFQVFDGDIGDATPISGTEFDSGLPDKKGG